MEDSESDNSTSNSYHVKLGSIDITTWVHELSLDIKKSDTPRAEIVVDIAAFSQNNPDYYSQVIIYKVSNEENIPVFGGNVVRASIGPSSIKLLAMASRFFTKELLEGASVNPYRR